MIDEIRKLRKELHQNPEVSGAEFLTANRIRSFIQKHHPTALIENLGGTGLAAVYEFGNGGTSVTIRCELDALPIHENNTFDHQSKIPGVSHKCGHDGHMAMVAGLIFWIKKQNFTSGKIILLFQPAEETGKGANAVLQDKRFLAVRTDYMFALHNIPKEPLHQIIIAEQGFSAEVQSCILTLNGKECHASEPENGHNPALAISEIIATLSGFNVTDPKDEQFSMLTPIHIKMGQPSYGISPATAELHYTLRTWSTENMSVLKTKMETAIERSCTSQQLTYKLKWLEYFPASSNHPESNRYVLQAAEENGFPITQRSYPFKFGEDFGWFTKDYKTTMFGLGAGSDTPALHHSDYDFPDEIIESGMAMFQTLISILLSENK